MTVAGIVDAGGAEDNQVFVNLPVAQDLAGLTGQIGLVQLRIKRKPKTITAYAQRLSTALPGLEVRPIRQVTDVEGELLSRIRLLILSMVLLILVLTGLVSWRRWRRWRWNDGRCWANESPGWLD